MTAPILAGAEPASFPGGPMGVLVLHGFTGNPQSMRAIAERLAADGHTVELPLLPGHGTAVEDLLPTRFDDWYAAAEAAFDDLAGRTDRLVVVGLSMGGTLATTLAAQKMVAGLVAVNAQIVPPAESFFEMLQATLDAGVDIIPGVGGDIALEGAEELAYPGTPIAGAQSLLVHCRTLVDDLLPRITCPVLILSSPQDHVVPPESSDTLAALVAGPVERVTLERSYHVATLDHDAALIEDSISRFVAKLAESG
jgi:carboxylesterase